MCIRDSRNTCQHCEFETNATIAQWRGAAISSYTCRWVGSSAAVCDDVRITVASHVLNNIRSTSRYPDQPTRGLTHNQDIFRVSALRAEKSWRLGCKGDTESRPLVRLRNRCI